MMLIELELEHAARKFCISNRQFTNAYRGRTDGPTYATWSTHVNIIEDSESAPTVKGLGYWKTGFNNGKGFSMTLYTPSSFRIEVGENWTPSEKYLT